MNKPKILIYKSKKNIYNNILLFAATAIASPLIANFTHEKNFNFIAIIAVIALIFKLFDLKNADFLTFSFDENKIETAQGVYKWEEIKNVIVKRDVEGESTVNYLRFQKKSDNNIIKIYIDDLDVDFSWLSNKLAQYNTNILES